MRAGLATSLSLPITTSFAGAQTLWWPCSTACAPRVVVVFIPGNPGVASYYIDFLHSIYTSPLIKPGVGIEILAVAHRGHAPLPKVGTNAVWGENGANQHQASKGYGVALRDQVRHKVAMVDAIRRMYPPEGGTKVVVVGHSIGAWMAGEVLKARPEAVDALHLLFPTLAWIGRTPNARRIQMLVNPLVTHLVLPLPLLLLSLLPVWMLVWVIRLVTGQPAAAALATAELLTTPGAVHNALSMAKQEFSTVQALPTSTIDSFKAFTSEQRGGRVRSYWASEESDSWAPTWIRSQVEAELSLQRVHLPPGLGVDTRTHGHGASRSHLRTRSFSMSEYRSAAGRIPDLRNARAIRKPNGEIVIEAKVEEPSSDSEDEPEHTEAQESARGLHYHYGRSRATSTHCRIGMPHAFCLKHSDDMAKIIAHWIDHDHLHDDKHN